ncbi:PH domain-containing protein [uncultured Muribaculum sp.]|uniref:PH domain-containing protein n=1 Tax=uncultured Muribaculum sp. TaxID=1918613 RepID=UPI0025E5A5A5|nr:PH domain-containing protein [uncultured Muribaculum sp.]
MDRTTTYFRSKVDWWVWATVVFTVAVCVIPLIGDDDCLLGICLGTIFGVMEIALFASIKYAIRGDELGVRMLWRWHWFPIDKISDMRKVTSILSSAALSVRRVAIRFSDRRILKSSAPIEISPKNRDAFMERLLEINPDIKIL